MTLIKATDITVYDGTTRLVDPVTLQLEPGEPLVILGETGSGKSLLAQALMGTLPALLSATGEVVIGPHRLRASAPLGFRALWGRAIAVLPQEPWLSLDPLMRAAPQVAETHRLVGGHPAPQARSRAQDDLSALGLTAAATRYPHELSGGMAQRVAIAAARAGGAPIVIADEPTKGLDAARRDDVAALLLRALGKDGGLIVITHDLALAQMISGQLIVLRSGAVVETGPTAQVFAAPRAAYTRDLIAADPARWPTRPANPASPQHGTVVLQAKSLGMSRGGQQLVQDLDLSLHSGQVLGITGASGCGKSSLGDALLGLMTPDKGQVIRAPGLAPTALQKLYQDPVSAFARKRSLGQTLRDVARLHHAPKDRIDMLLARLRLDPALLQRRPGAVSGGELQRLALLRAILANPRVLFADEPTSRLDPITQREVVFLLHDMARSDDIALALVSHDMDLIEKMADQIHHIAAPADAALSAPDVRRSA